MGNDRRQNIIRQFKESKKETPTAVKEKQDFLDAIEKLIQNWVKTFPNDSRTINLLNKLLKNVKFNGVSSTTKNQFNNFLDKYNEKSR
ncbi:MAG: hypothetical protein WC137_02085 [Alphaproteobacteria bacterium]